MCQASFHKTIENMKKIVGNLPGFRKEIPLSMLITQCGGQRNFKMSVIEEILTVAMPIAMEKTGELVVSESERIASDVNQMEEGFDPAKPFSFEVEFETAPPITWVKPYKGLEVTIRDNGDFSTDSAAVEDLIHQYRKSKGFQRVVQGRGLEKGDTCIMDIEVTPTGGGKPLPGLSKNKAPLDTDLDPLGLVPGMLGMAVGDERTVPISFPEDYSVELWRGTSADAMVKVHELFYWVLPEFDDAFVKAHHGQQWQTADEFRKGLLAETAMERIKELDRQLEDSLLDAVVGCMSVPEVPEKLVLDMGMTQYRSNLLRMLQTGAASKEDAEKLLTEELMEEYIAKNRKDLEDLVKFNLAVEAIFLAEGLKVDEADVASEMEMQKQSYEGSDVEYDADVMREQVVDNFKNVMVIEWLKDNCQRNVQPYVAADTA